MNKNYLAYCTNIHPAESWQDTFSALKNYALQVRDELRDKKILQPFPLAPRLSARAASELLEGNHLADFKKWIEQENCCVFTINGFPYGAFHDTRVKEQVYRPDWTEESRITYTKNLFVILAELLESGSEGSVSTLPGSFKEFHADESLVMKNLCEFADWLEKLSQEKNLDLHLGLEPEPLGLFENTEETLLFFEKLFEAGDKSILQKRIGVNYDTCHFALEYDDCHASLQKFHDAGIRISKVHLAAALAVNTSDVGAYEALLQFNEPTYLHQVLLKNADGEITRFRDLPEFFVDEKLVWNQANEARVHFHIPLDAAPLAPLRSTRDHAEDLLEWKKMHPHFCHHYEIETYTWSVLPQTMHRPLEQQLAAEYRWVLERF